MLEPYLLSNDPTQLWLALQQKTHSLPQLQYRPHLSPLLRLVLAPFEYSGMADLTPVIVRTVTVFVPKECCNPVSVFRRSIAAAVQKAQQTKSVLLNQGIPVQTIRISLPSPAVFGSQQKALEAACILDEAEVDFSSLGVIFPEDTDFVSSEFYADVIRETKSVSLVASLTSPKMGAIDSRAISTAAAAVLAISKLDEHGFSNFRFAAMANVLPNGPFFPASYASRDQQHLGYNPQQFSIALGVQGATLLHHIVSQRKGNIHGVYEAFTAAIENCAQLLVTACAPVTSVSIDFSTAPAPGSEHSIGEVLATCGSVTRFPGVGGLTAAARLADAIDRARFPRTGFCGIMIPVCEDDVFAANPPSLSELLMCSSVCGTGLDVSFVTITSFLTIECS